ncbi:MAG: mannose-1-phosphate guanylyltransferase [Bacteroidales bacterium]|nr:mannose-1-phosphate guanylyltransferase [Bacteroidales bacterium]MDD4234884.1 mannose-1-phosphate guanylyltransferase [Bacteroidales bacterium]
MNKNNYCIIMAGGIGSRFWPISLAEKPKQFLDIIGCGRTLIQQTYDRFINICPAENIFIVTGEEYKEIVLDQLPSIKEDNILTEPMRRNTAPCIAYSNYKIKKINPNANIVVTPADHLIINEDLFIQNIIDGISFAQSRNILLTLGIKPDRPATGYGYIQIENKEISGDFIKAKSFTEKPNIELAKFFIESGEFYWNSGIFIWTLNSIDKAFNEFLPEIHNLFEEHYESFNTPQESSALRKIYTDAKSISIDYGVMEKADNVYVLCTNFGWSDLGTWNSLYTIGGKDEYDNVKLGNDISTYNSSGNYIRTTEDKILAIKDMEDYIIVNTDKVLLICKRENEQDIKDIVNQLNK